MLGPIGRMQPDVVDVTLFSPHPFGDDEPYGRQRGTLLLAILALGSLGVVLSSVWGLDEGGP